DFHVTGVQTCALPIFAFLFSSQLFIHAQCPTGGVSFTSQTALDNFILDYPTCEVIDGNVSINGPDIIDLSPLSNIKTINGYLTRSEERRIGKIVRTLY